MGRFEVVALAGQTALAWGTPKPYVAQPVTVGGILTGVGVVVARHDHAPIVAGSKQRTIGPQIGQVIGILLLLVTFSVA